MKRLLLPLSLILAILGCAASSFAVTPKLAAGSYHTMRLRADGTLWGCGVNAFGQLGDGTLTSRSSAVQIGKDHDWIAVAAGDNHTLALKADGSLWSWGRNGSGELGDGTTRDRKVPVRIGNARDWKGVAAGVGSSFALKGDGTLWGWGRNDRGQLGTGDTVNASAPVPVANPGLSRYVAVAAGGSHTVALQADGTLWGWGDNTLAPLQIGGDSDWTAIAAGGVHSLALKGDGSLWGWGQNGFGQLGTGSADQTVHATPLRIGLARDWKAIAAGDLHSAALKQDGTLWTWGDNTSGQLGDGGVSEHDAPARIEVTDLVDMVGVAAGAAHTAALRADGELYAFGDNGVGQLGNGSIASAFLPVAAGRDGASWVASDPGGNFTVARRGDGTLWSWGDNASGQLGDGNGFAERLTPAQVGTGHDWTAQSAGWSHTVALKADGTLWSWGDNSFGQLGVGSGTGRETPAQVLDTVPSSADNDWKAVAAGDFHTLALKADGTLWGWGRNASGEVGDGSGADQAVPVRIVTGNPGNFDANWVAVAAGGAHSLALQADGTLWGWGENGAGQLGDATFTGALSLTPQQVVSFSVPAGNPGYNSSWTAVAAGLSHTVALQADGTAWGWGNNYSGQLGNGDSALPATAGSHVQVLDPGGAPFREIVAGDAHSAAILTDGTLWSFGGNLSGQLGNGASDGDPANSHATPVREVGLASDWAALGSGGSEMTALRGESLWLWGSNASGQLGDASTADRSTPAPLPGGRISVAPLIAFNAATIGLPSTRTLAVGNAGAAPLAVDALTILGADGAAFGEGAGSCGAPPFTVPAGQSCSVALTFAPATAGEKRGTLSLATTDPDGGSVTVALSGSALFPFTIAKNAGPNGSITGPATANLGDSPSFAVTPSAGYHVADVTVNGVSQGAAAAVTVPQIGADAVIGATFAINSYAVTLAPGANGSIQGPLAVNHGDTPSFTITPNPGAYVTDVLVNGVSQGNLPLVTLPPVTGNVTVAATFGVTTFHVTGACDPRGTISPSGAVAVPYGASQSFTFTPNPGYQVVKVLVDGVSKGAVTSFTVANVLSGGHTVQVVFTPDGDLNNDGKVDVADALGALRIAVGLAAPGTDDLLHGDVAPLDASGIPVPDRRVGVEDALVILKKTVGVLTSF